MDKHRPLNIDRILLSSTLYLHWRRLESILVDEQLLTITSLAAFGDNDGLITTFFPWIPNESWFTAINSGLVRIYRVVAFIFLISEPIINGALVIDQREKCDWYSISVISPLPIWITK